MIAGTAIGALRIGAPAANTLAGTASVAIIVVTANTNRRHMEASHDIDLKIIVTTAAFKATAHSS